MSYFPVRPGEQMFDDDTVNYHGSNLHKVNGKWYNYARIGKNIASTVALIVIVGVALRLMKKYKEDGESVFGTFCMGKRGTYSKVADVNTQEVTSHSLYTSDSDH